MVGYFSFVLYVTQMGKFRTAFNIFVRKPRGKNPFGRPTRRWEDNITINCWV